MTSRAVRPPDTRSAPSAAHSTGAASMAIACSATVPDQVDASSRVRPTCRLSGSRDPGAPTRAAVPPYGDGSTGVVGSQAAVVPAPPTTTTRSGRARTISSTPARQAVRRSAATSADPVSPGSSSGGCGQTTPETSTSGQPADGAGRGPGTADGRDHVEHLPRLHDLVDPVDPCTVPGADRGGGQRAGEPFADRQVERLADE